MYEVGVSTGHYEPRLKDDDRDVDALNPCIYKVPIKWARRDLNPRPRDYESPALTAELQALLKEAHSTGILPMIQVPP